MTVVSALSELLWGCDVSTTVRGSRALFSGIWDEICYFKSVTKTSEVYKYMDASSDRNNWNSESVR